jgi:hypothetical protein
MTLANKTTVKIKIQLRQKLKRLSEEEVNPPSGRLPRKRMKKEDFSILPLRTRTILRGNECYESKIL